MSNKIRLLKGLTTKGLPKNLCSVGLSNFGPKFDKPTRLPLYHHSSCNSRCLSPLSTKCPMGINSDRTNPAPRESGPVGQLPQCDHWHRNLRRPCVRTTAGLNSRIPAAGVSAPCRLNKAQQSNWGASFVALELCLKVHYSRSRPE